VIASAASRSACCCQRSRCSRMSSSIDLKSDSRASARVARVVASARVPRYASFLRTVPRAGVIRQGRVNPMQFAGLDGPLAELIPPCTDPARLDASQDRRFRHADSFCRLPEGVTHVLLSVP
jgi:hypothetical protein